MRFEDKSASLKDEKFMRLALSFAEKAAEMGEAPIGCVVVCGGEPVSFGLNMRELQNDPTAHAEVLALREAGRKLGTWKLTECELYVTLEPCAMCAGAIVSARIKRVIYGCGDPKAGAVKTLYQICSDARLNHRAEVVGGVLADESASLLQSFFKALRQK